jgi:hypothetical protein
MANTSNQKIATLTFSLKMMFWLFGLLLLEVDLLNAWNV